MYLDNKDYILKRFAYSDIVRGELITSYSIEVTDEHDYPDKGYTDYYFETNSYYYDVGKYRQVIRKMMLEKYYPTLVTVVTLEILIHVFT